MFRCQPEALLTLFVRHPIVSPRARLFERGAGCHVWHGVMSHLPQLAHAAHLSRFAVLTTFAWIRDVVAIFGRTARGMSPMALSHREAISPTVHPRHLWPSFGSKPFRD